jgi:hypothetical protein
MYEIVITDLSYVPQGQILSASNVQYFRGLSKLAGLSFQVPMSSPHVDRLSTVNGYIKVYRKGALIYVGPIVAAEENAQAEARSLAITSADNGWYLGKLLAGKSRTGILYQTVTARHTIAKNAVDSANTTRETGVSTSGFSYSSGSSITHKVGPYVSALQVLQEVGNALDGYDWFVHPRENWVNGAVDNQKVGNLEISTLIGATKADAVFEYGVGTRSNVLSYTKTTTRDTQATHVFHVTQDASDVKTGTNTAAATNWGILEDVAQGDFTDATMRQKLVDEHAAVRGNPRTIIKMTPHIDPGGVGHVPEPFVDYNVGDTVTFRASDAGIVRFSGSVRVYGIRTTVDEAGFERVELILEDE